MPQAEEGRSIRRRERNLEVVADDRRIGDGRFPDRRRGQIGSAYQFKSRPARRPGNDYL